MHSQHLLVLSPESLSISYLPNANLLLHQSSWSGGIGSGRCRVGSRSVARLLASAHVRANQFLISRQLRGSRSREVSASNLEISQLGQADKQSWSLSRVLFRESKLSRTSSKVGKDADSFEDLNLEELNDEQLDELFETYGEDVDRAIDPTPESTSSEADADAESLAFAVALAGAANDVKAGEIQVLFVKPLVYWTRFFVIATGFSRPQVSAIGKKMRDLAEERFKKFPRGDLKPNAWTLLDFGDVVVHIFYPTERAFYNLEEFYGNATVVELPFNTQSSMN